jgi:hypothetical protein
MTDDRSALSAAMQAGDLLAEAERRYEIIANLLDPQRELRESERGLTGTEVKALSIEADRLMHKIVSLRAEAAASAQLEADKTAPGDGDKYGKVVAFDAGRFRKSG